MYVALQGQYVYFALTGRISMNFDYKPKATPLGYDMIGLQPKKTVTKNVWRSMNPETNF